MRKILTVTLSVILAISLWACETTPSSDRTQAKQTELALSEAQRQIGMPQIVNFQQRKLMKCIYELADRADLVTYTYIKANYGGKLVFMCKSIGYGIPFSAQFTNPEKQINYDLSLPQADPNGLFMPVASSATWVIAIQPETGKPHPIYFEPEIVVSPFPLSPYLGDIVVGNEANWGKKDSN